MPIAYLEMSPEFLTTVIQGFQSPIDQPRWFRVVENELPIDSKCVGCSHYPLANTIRLTLESQEFTDGETLEPVHLEAVKDLS